MDKLENESWAEYAFKHEAFYIVYADKEKQIIDDVRFADPENKYYYPYTSDYRSSTGTDIVWRKIEEIVKKYKLNGHNYDMKGISYSAQKKMNIADIDKQNTLYNLYEFYKQKETYYQLKKYNRYMELIKIISETHKEEFEELSKIAHITPPYIPPAELEYQETRKESNKRYAEKLTREKLERVEIYKKYLKNNEIRSQINELKQKINKLKGEIV
jgi:hypothetical protein